MHIPSGFSIASLPCSLRSHGSGDDVAFIVADEPANFGLVTTQNSYIGEPVKWCRTIKEKQDTIRGLLIHVGQANVGTGLQGAQDVQSMAEIAAKEIQSSPEEILIAGTGVIGERVKIQNFKDNFHPRFGSSAESFESGSNAILTTDLVPKILSSKVGKASILGIAKGSGMIEPNMATMLGVILTDADFSSNELQEMLARVTEQSFNCVSVDTDTSTSDMGFLLSSGNYPVNKTEFEAALLDICVNLSRKIAQDGEGATKLLTAIVSNAKTYKEAQIVGKSIINSPLVKSAIFGNDPNWGRILMAIGKTEVTIEPEQVKVSIGETIIFDGQPIEFDAQQLAAYFKSEDEIVISVNLRQGSHSATCWGCDLSYDYVKINAEYTT